MSKPGCAGSSNSCYETFALTERHGMTEKTTEPGTRSEEFNPEEMQSALFAQLVMQQSNLAMMLLGKGPQPESGQSMRDLEAA